jgi:hypothetical protein
LGILFRHSPADRESAAIVFSAVDRPRAVDVVGFVTKRAIADTVIVSVED